MKNQTRRKFLLFIGQVGLVSMSGCLDTCTQKRSSHSQPPKPDLMKLEMELLEVLEAGKKIKLKWDCGGDQAIVTTTIDEIELPYNSDFLNGLDIYIINYLNLPDIGEFELVGEGEIIDENDNLYLVCESTMIGYEEYSENYDSSEWKVINERDEMYSGKKELFR